ncbi:VOC family protein [Streptomyces sp. AC627_RSS907]|uniref:VOC family protein n=1 Tax=Streptomyces sp. AC627_RSS907 TaxID=2823684 RepID=UPI0027E57005|nr:VOC family protein [Streptomyces sp. AC627_RSS907]
MDAQLSDVEAGKRFYGELFGWTFEEAGVTGPGAYTWARLDGEPVAALARKPDGRLPTVWTVYFAAADAGALAGRIRAAGGQIVTPPRPVDDLGTTALVADPQGAVFALWQPGADATAARGTAGSSGAPVVRGTAGSSGAPVAPGTAESPGTPEAPAVAEAPGAPGTPRSPRTPGARPPGDGGRGIAPGAPGAAPGTRRTTRFTGFGRRYEPGTFAWVELYTRDTEAAGAFYGELFQGALPGPGAAPGFGRSPVSDVFPAEMPPHFLVHFLVEDCEAALGAVTRLGGRVRVPPFETSHGRVAVVSDGQGASFALLQR